MTWVRQRCPRTGVDQWALARVGGRWIVYAVRGRRTHANPSGEFWRAMCEGVVVRLRQRVRSWRSRHAAMGAVEELARLEART